MLQSQDTQFRVKSEEKITVHLFQNTLGGWQRHRKAKMCSNDKRMHLCKPRAVRFLRPTQSLTHSNLGASWDKTCWQEAQEGEVNGYPGILHSLLHALHIAFKHLIVAKTDENIANYPTNNHKS